MVHCPTCGFEDRKELQRCPKCGGKLEPGPLPASTPVRSSADTEPVRLCTVPDVTAGDILRAVLAENGVPALVQRHGPITGELGRVTDGLTDDHAIVMVPANRLEEAREILEAVESAPTVWPEGMEPDEEDEEDDEA